MRFSLFKNVGVSVSVTCIVLAILVLVVSMPSQGHAGPILILLSLAVVSMLAASWNSRIFRNDGATMEQSLHSALDFTSDGIAVLDGQMRAVYTNREFRRLFQMGDGMAAKRLAFADIVAHGRDRGIYDVPAETMDAFCVHRIAFVKAGNTQPMTLRIAGGTTLRFHCRILPDGGRMLTYSNITDLTHDAERLEELAHIDGMTGLINRRRFFDLAEREWEMAMRYGRDISVLMLDIDHFKKVNDTYGHDNGDEAIKIVAAICNDSRRATDIAARVGGEEFALLLPETDVHGALILAERIRLRVAANPIICDGKPVPLTVSIGTAERSADLDDFNALLKRSDQMLYAAKSAGRNCVMHRIETIPAAPHQTAAA